MADDNGRTRNDLIRLAQDGDRQAFSTLFAEYDYDVVIREIVRTLTSQDTEKRSRETLFRKIITDVFRTLSEFRIDRDSFEDWLRRTAKARVGAERIKVLRAQKGDKNSFLDLIVEYEHVIHELIREYTPKLREHDERTLLAATIDDAYWALRKFRLHQDVFELWFYETARENCFFLHLKELLRDGIERGNI
ncbi:MAG: hypothetical protein GY801_41785 [bacterium]|nr:hypothetical protein [bacterium]